MWVPAAVKEAVRAVVPDEGFVLKPSKPSETSIIFDWGARVEYFLDGVAEVGWICLGSESCRGRRRFIHLSIGKTPRATKHLKEVHQVQSDKTLVEFDRTRSREEICERLRKSDLFRDDPGRMVILLETLRVVNNNLAYRFGEYEESRIIRNLTMAKEIQVAFNAKVVSHSIVGLYASTKKENVSYIQELQASKSACFSIVADYWTSKVQCTKFLGMRLYFVDNSWEFRSILLETRHFDPDYDERSTGIRGPYQRWITDVLHDFGLERCDLFGAIGDAGPDVKWMLRHGLQLQWEWRLPHLTNAVTKMACGMVGDATRSKNRGMTNLISRVANTVYQVKHVEALGSLFAHLREMLGEDKSQQLLTFKSHRFMGLTRIVQRILEKWRPLEAWFEEQIEEARRHRKSPPSPFPLTRDKEDLVHLLSLLAPITEINKKSQAESANHVDVLLSLYELRLTVLDPSRELKSYKRTAQTPIFITELMPLATNTRLLLRALFQKNFSSATPSDLGSAPRLSFRKCKCFYTPPSRTWMEL